MAGLQLDMDRVRYAIKDGWISKRPHPEYPLFIYNYTPQCQYDWHWTPETIACRGLILDDKDNVIARPFTKFFTPDQYKDLRNNVHHLYGLRYKELYQGKFTVTEKVDGSMGILYKWDGKIAIASRGSFTSAQAIHATELVQQYQNFDFTHDATYLFEIVYPGNRIVVNYGDRDELVLLTVLDNNTGADREACIDDWRNAGYPTRNTFHFENFDDIMSNQGDGEGFVVKFEHGLRVKVKFDEYVRLHRILTQVSARDIWWRIRNGEDLNDLLGLVPDEFYAWMRKVECELRMAYNEIEQHVQDVIYKEIVKRHLPLTRKQLAIKYQEYKYKAIMFQMLDTKEYKESIWRLLRPAAERPFAGIATAT